MVINTRSPQFKILLTVVKNEIQPRVSEIYGRKRDENLPGSCKHRSNPDDRGVTQKPVRLSK
jgi:hypothetical protein